MYHQTGFIFAHIKDIDSEIFIRCNGQHLDKDRYCNLYRAIGDKYNNANTPGNHFSVPNLDGVYIRSIPVSTGIGRNNYQRILGNIYPQSYERHTHNNYELEDSGEHTHTYASLKKGRWFHDGSERINMSSVENYSGFLTEEAGEHSHVVTLLNGGDSDVLRPDSFVIRYFIIA